MTTFLRTAPDDPAGTTTRPTAIADPTGTAHPTGTAEPAGRSRLARLLAVVGPAVGAVSLAFGTRVSPHAVAILLHRDSRWTL